MGGDSINERIPRDQEDSGSIGIGAMIVFIALILVAAVASTTSSSRPPKSLQNAEQTSSDTRQQISGKVAITDLIIRTTGDDLGIRNRPRGYIRRFVEGIVRFNRHLPR